MGNGGWAPEGGGDVWMDWLGGLTERYLEAFPELAEGMTVADREEHLRILDVLEEAQRRSGVDLAPDVRERLRVAWARAREALTVH